MSRAADKRTRSAMLAGAHAAYELKENIIVCGHKCQELEVRFGGARRSVGRTLRSQRMPTRRSARRCGDLVASRGLDNEEGCWSTLRKLIGSWSRFPDEP